MLSDLIKLVQAHYEGREADTIGVVLVSALSEIDRRLSELEARPDLARLLEDASKSADDILTRRAIPWSLTMGQEPVKPEQAGEALRDVIEPRAVGQSRRSASLDAVSRLEAEADGWGGRRDLSDGTFPSCPSCGRAHQDCGRRVDSGHDAAARLEVSGVWCGRHDRHPSGRPAPSCSYCRALNGWTEHTVHFAPDSRGPVCHAQGTPLPGGTVATTNNPVHVRDCSACEGAARSAHDAAMALADQIRGGLEEGIRTGSSDPTQPIPWPSRAVVEALYQLKIKLTTAEQREAMRALERAVYERAEDET